MKVMMEEGCLGSKLGHDLEFNALFEARWVWGGMQEAQNTERYLGPMP